MTVWCCESCAALGRVTVRNVGVHDKPGGGWTPMHPTYPVPIRLAPDLDPADAVHVPRWLDDLRKAERQAEAPFSVYAVPSGLLHDLFNPGPTTNHARWLDG